MLNFLLCHPKDIDAALLEHAVAAATLALSTQAGGQPFTVVAARDDYAANFEKAGSWDAWIERAATGADFATRKPFFNGFLSLSRSVGRATGILLSKGLGIGKPVTVLEADGSLGAVKRVTQVSQSYKDGYWLEIP